MLSPPSLVTFTGYNQVTDRLQQMEVSHYAKVPNAPSVPLRLSSAKSVWNTINKNFGTLPFCRRYLDRLGQEKYLLGVSRMRIFTSDIHSCPT